MPTSIIAVTDLPQAIQDSTEADLLEAMVNGANARAGRVAPCLADQDTPPTDDQVAEAKLILIGAVKRWAEAGAGAFQSQTAGPFGVQVDTRQRSGFNLWPSEITDLQDICREDTDAKKAFMIDQAQPTTGTTLADRPDLWFQWAQPVPPEAP